MREKSELEKRYDQAVKDCDQEERAIRDEYYAAYRKAKTQLEALAEKHGVLVQINDEKYIPHSMSKIFGENGNLSEELVEYIQDWHYSLGLYGDCEEPGGWWAPSNC